MIRASPVIPSERGTCFASLGAIPGRDRSLRSGRRRGSGCSSPSRCSSRPRGPARRPGRPPRPSPRPIGTSARATRVTALFGQFGGAGGRFGIGPHDGQIYGLRYDLRTGSTIQIGLGLRPGRPAAADRRSVRFSWSTGVSRARWTRRVTFAEVEPPAQPDRRQDLAPAGAVRRARAWASPFPAAPPPTPAGSSSGNKIYLAPTAGVRDLRHRPALAPRRGPRRLPQAQVSLDLRGRARGSSRATRPTTPTPSSPTATSASGPPARCCSVGLGYSFSP